MYRAGELGGLPGLFLEISRKVLRAEAKGKWEMVIDVDREVAAGQCGGGGGAKVLPCDITIPNTDWILASEKESNRS